MRIFRFIAAKRAEHSIQIMCRVLEVSRSGFYAWTKRKPSARARHAKGLIGGASRRMHKVIEAA